MGDSGLREPGKLGRLQSKVQTLIDEDAAAAAEADLGSWQRFAHFWILTGQMFHRNRGPSRASSLAYTTLLALVPLLAISLSVASLFLPTIPAQREAKLVEWIEYGVARVAPTLGLADQDGGEQRKKTATQIVGFVERINFGTIGATAAAGLLVVAIGLLRTVEVTLNDIWGVTRGRSLLVSIVFYWAVITLGPVVVLVAKGANYLQFLDQSPATLQSGAFGQFLLSVSVVVTPVIMAVALAALYFWMPNTRVRWQAALAGGTVAAVLWTLNGKISALYNTKVLTYNAIYGTLGALPLFLVGLYFTWLIVLFGAQVAYVFQHRKAYLQERLAGRIHQHAREFAAVRLMAHVGTRFAAGEKPVGALRLAESLALPPNLAKELLPSLAGAQLLNETSGPEAAYAPARPCRITVCDILQALRCGAGSDLATAADDQRPVVREALAGVQKASDAEAGAVTVEDLVRRCGAGAPPQNSREVTCGLPAPSAGPA